MKILAAMVAIAAILVLRPVLALTDTDILLTDGDIAALGGSRIGERCAVSVQAHSLFDMFSRGALAQAMPQSSSQRYVSLLAGGVKTTVYYYRFRNRDEASRALQFVRPFIWGGDRPSILHPERIYHFDNYLLVVSSPSRNPVDDMIADKVLRIPVPRSLLQTLQVRMRCGGREFDSPCGVLESLGTGGPLPVAAGGPCFGHSWEIGSDGRIEKTFYEVLHIKAERDGLHALWMPVRPDNDGERVQMEGLIARQKGGGVAEPPEDLAAYLAGMFTKHAVPLKYCGTRRAYLSTKGNTAQLLRVREGYVLIVATEHWTGRPERIILAYFWNRTR